MESFPVAQIGRPKASEFVFARLRYDAGDWDHNPKVAANVLNSLVEYTTIPVYGEEVVITVAASACEAGREKLEGEAGSWKREAGNYLLSVVPGK